MGITQGLTSFTFSPFGPTAAHLLNLGFDSGEKVSRETLKVETKIKNEIIYEYKFCFCHDHK